MSKINFNDKVENSGASADGKVTASNINEIKTSVNSLYDNTSNIDNTSDINKPVSIAQSTALNTKKDKSIIISSNSTTTASNDSSYHITSTVTFIDPTGVEGKGYDIEVLEGGVVTFGNYVYNIAGTIIKRRYNNSVWNNYLNAIVSKETKNLFNPYTTVDNYFMANSGGYSVSAGFAVSDFIPVVPGETYCGSDYINSGFRFSAYFDSTKTLVAGGSNSTQTSITIPAGVYFIKITIHDVKLKFNFQFEKGVFPTNRFIGYKELKEPLIPISNLKNVRKTRNLFNRHTVTMGKYMDGSGNITINAAYAYSDFIKLEKGVFYYGHDRVNNMRFVTYFDKNKNFLNIGNNSSQNAIFLADNSAAEYVIISVSSDRLWAFQLELNAYTFYEPHGFLIGGNKTGKTILTNTSWEGGIMGTLGDSLTNQAAWQPFVCNQTGMTLLNYGISGTKVADPLGSDTNAMCRDSRIDAISLTCDLITFLGGTNDWAQSIPIGSITDTTATTFYGALYLVASKLTTRFPTKKILWMTPPYGTYTAFTTPTAPYEKNDLDFTTKDYGTAVIEVARQWGFPCIDLHANSGINRLNYTNYLVDRLHWNDIGGIRVANLVTNRLQSIDIYP